MPYLLRYLLLLLLISSAAYAQVDTIIPNPKSVSLRRIWRINPTAYAAGSIGDVNGDSLGDFAVLCQIPWKWQVYYGAPGGPSKMPTWTFDSGTSEVQHPVAGDFWGTGHRAVGFLRWDVSGATHYWLHIFRTDSNRLDSTPALVWNSVSNRDTTRMYVHEILAADLDQDGDDELIIVSPTGRRGGMFFSRAETWIFEGGPNFQVDTPTVVLRDPLPNSDYSQGNAFVTDYDRDGFVDLIRGGSYDPGQQLKISIYWGDGRLPLSERLPDRTFDIPGLVPRMADVDGDGALDLISDGPRIWRSGSGKNARTRSFDPLDADRLLTPGVGQARAFRLGHLNSKRYEMVGRTQLWYGEVMLTAFTGGANGPNRTWDAYYLAGNEGRPNKPFQLTNPVGDVDGDGWDDVLVNMDGLAMILVGGPYIPADDPSVGVRDIAVDGAERAISVWPNPVTTELNIAWRGNLSRTPHRFEIYDMLGCRVATGVIDDGPSALWQCGDVTAGEYRLCVFDQDGTMIASTSIVKVD